MLAHRIVRKVWQAMLVQTSEHMTNGQTLLMVAPDYRAEEAAAELIAEWREVNAGQRHKETINGQRYCTGTGEAQDQ